MVMNQNEKDNLKRYGRVSGLEDALKDSNVNQNPTILSNVLMGLGNDVLGDPLQALRRNPYDMAAETQRYLGYNWNQEGGENISQLIEENQAEILGNFADQIDEKLSEAGNDKIRASGIIGQAILGLTPEILRRINSASESEKRQMMYANRASTKPYLTQNTAFYEDTSQAVSLMIKNTGADYLQSDGEGDETRFVINRGRIAENFAERKQIYATMASQTIEAPQAEE